MEVLTIVAQSRDRRPRAAWVLANTPGCTNAPERTAELMGLSGFWSSPAGDPGPAARVLLSVLARSAAGSAGNTGGRSVFETVFTPGARGTLKRGTKLVY